ncbi:MAG: cytochrome P450 [Akkermansiaceae bacterium]
MNNKCPFDAFKKQRVQAPVLTTDFNGEPIEMVLKHQHVVDAAKDWQTFSSSGAYKVPIPSEEHCRSVRQFPIETDPDEHGDYRKLIEPVFRKPLDSEFISKIEELISTSINEACAADSVEIVSGFSLPIQSYALTHLIGMPQSEAKTWIEWGVHVFHQDGEMIDGTASHLEDYINEQLEKRSGGDDMFSLLNAAQYRGRALTQDEKAGFANLVFAGGRDTVIHQLTGIVAYFAENPEKLAQLNDSKSVRLATEEFFRVFSTITQIGRYCPEETELHGVTVPKDHRVSLCWASANFDPEKFDEPEEIRLDRKPNPHMAFGRGIHNCIGAAHARLLARTLISKLHELRVRIETIETVPNIERNPGFERHNGYNKLLVRMSVS